MKSAVFAPTDESITTEEHFLRAVSKGNQPTVFRDAHGQLVAQWRYSEGGDHSGAKSTDLMVCVFSSIFDGVCLAHMDVVVIDDCRTKRIWKTKLAKNTERQLTEGICEAIDVCTVEMRWRESVNFKEKIGLMKPTEMKVTQTPKCPKCTSRMKVRTARRGAYKGNRFWGCSTYPGCDGIRKYVKQAKVPEQVERYLPAKIKPLVRSPKKTFDALQEKRRQTAPWSM